MKRIGLVAVIVALMAALFIPTGLVYAQDIYLWPASDWAEIEFDGYFDGYADYDVTLFWDYDTDDEAILATTPTTVTTDDGGYFEGSFVIPAAATTGAHTVTAMIDYVEGEMYSNDAVVMVLTGPAVDPVFVNETRSEELAFPGVTVEQGEKLTVVTGRLSAAIDASGNGNRGYSPAAVVADEDVTEYAVGDAIMLSPGPNMIRVRGQGFVPGETWFEIYWYDAFGG